jgi:hypothetical protein
MTVAGLALQLEEARRIALDRTAVDQVVRPCAEILPEEPVPDRARLVLEDIFAEGGDG